MTRSKSLKCDVCPWSTRGARKRPNVVETMHRLYIKEKGSLKAVGWFCKNCGSVVLVDFRKGIQVLSPPQIKVVAETS